MTIGTASRANRRRLRKLANINRVKRSNSLVESDRCNVAQDKSTPKYLLRRLARDRAFNVRWFVALNTNTPSNALAELANDPRFNIRYNVARNPSTPAYVLRQMAKTDDYNMKLLIARNKSTPQDVLFMFAMEEPRLIERK